MNKSLSFKYKVSGFLTDCYQRAATSIMVFILPLAVLGQGYRLTGKVMDEQAQPLEFVNVSLRDTVNDNFYGDVTDVEGNFSITNISQGNYQLTVSFVGFATYQKQLNLTANTQLEDIKLSYEPAGLAEVTVTHRLPTITRKVDRYVVNVANSAAATGKTGLELIGLSPGVNVSPFGDIKIQGISGTAIMLDGKLMRLSADEIKNFLNNLNAEDIQVIEVITTPPAEYDAEGLSGIISIKLKKSVSQGFKSNVYVAYEQYYYSRFKSGFDIDYSFKNLRIYGNYGNDMGPNLYKSYDKIYLNNNILQERNRRSKHEGTSHDTRLGIDIDISKNHVISIEGFLNLSPLSGSMNGFFQSMENKNINETIEGEHYYKENNNLQLYNFSYRWTIDTMGQSLSFRSDYAKIQNTEKTFYLYKYNIHSNPNSQPIDKFQIDKDHYNIYSARIDYTKPFGMNGKFSAGLKATRTTLTNNSRFEEKGEINPNRSNSLKYYEKIIANYIQLSSKFNKIEFQLGIRGEYTKNTNQNKGYYKLFPSIFIKHPIGSKKIHSINYSYSRRINRPSYKVTNPSTYYIDDYSAYRGNSELKPSLIDAFKLSYIFKKNIFSLNYSNISDFWDYVLEKDEKQPDLIYTTYENIGKENHYYFGWYAPFKIFQWWEIIGTLDLNYQETIHKKNDYKNNKKYWSFSISNHFTLPHDFQIETYFKYRSKTISGLYELAPSYYGTIAIKKKLLKGKLTANLSFSDVFHVYKDWEVAYKSHNVKRDSFYTYDLQGITLMLKYRFLAGKKFKKSVKTEKPEELERTHGF